MVHVQHGREVVSSSCLSGFSCRRHALCRCASFRISYDTKVRFCGTQVQMGSSLSNMAGCAKAAVSCKARGVDRESNGRFLRIEERLFLTCRRRLRTTSSWSRQGASRASTLGTLKMRRLVEADGSGSCEAREASRAGSSVAEEIGVPALVVENSDTGKVVSAGQPEGESAARLVDAGCRGQNVMRGRSLR